MSSLLLPAEINTNGLIGIWFSIHGPSRGDALLIFDYLKKSNMLGNGRQVQDLDSILRI